jgi:uncharacterized membrane protein YebE (DUF533 family)
MSFIGTLAKVAVGVAIAKGVGSMMQASKQGGAVPRAGTGTTYGGPQSRGTAPQGSGAPGGLQDIMRDVLAGTPAAKTAPAGRAPAPQPGSLPGGLGGLLEQLAGGAAGGTATRAGTSPGAGGLDDLLGSLASSGGLGGLLGGLVGAAGGAAAAPAPGRAAPEPNAGFGDLLNQSLRNYGEPDVPPAPQQEAAAALLLRAMIQAAKSDGKVDAAERAKLLDGLKDATQAEVDFVKAELAAPVDIEGLARQVPKGLEAQVYTMSVMAITLDNRAEAQYLHELATALRIAPAQVNAIHTQLGVPTLYS